MTIIFGFGRQMETCTLLEFRGINSKTQVQAPPAKRQPTPKYKKSYQNKYLHATNTLKQIHRLTIAFHILLNEVYVELPLIQVFLA